MRHPIWQGLGWGVCFATAFSAVALASATWGDGDGFFEEGFFEIGGSAPRVLAVYWAVGIVGGLLLGILGPLGERVDRTAPRNRRLGRAYAVLLIVWFGLHGSFRTWAADAGLANPWVLGVAPSLFAGLAVAFGSALLFGFRSLAAGVFGAGFIILTETVQPWLPSYTLDPWDMVIGVVGASLAVPLLMRWPVAVHTESTPAERVISA